MSHAREVRGSALVFGRDYALLETRRKLLLADGYATDTAGDLNDLISFLQAGKSYDILVLCHSATEADKQMIEEALKHASINTPVYRMEAGSRPGTFLRAVASRTGKERLLRLHQGI